MVLVAIGAVVVVASGVLAIVLLGRVPRGVPVTSPSPDPAVAAQCRELVAALPGRLGGARRRDTDPATGLTAAWGEAPVVLACGVGRPAALQPTSILTEVDGVAWLAEPLTAGVVFTTVGRAAYVELTVPATAGPAGDLLVELAPTIRATVPPA